LTQKLGAIWTVDRVNDTIRFRPRAETKLSTFYAITEARSLPPRLFTVERPSLEAVFLHLTGRKLRQ
jgi:ABC-2 type transport system ATP-binding protein